MSKPARFQFTLGQVMGAVAVSAVLLASLASGGITYAGIIRIFIFLIEIFVVFSYVRLSTWMWLVLASDVAGMS